MSQIIVDYTALTDLSRALLDVKAGFDGIAGVTKAAGEYLGSAEVSTGVEVFGTNWSLARQQISLLLQQVADSAGLAALEYQRIEEGIANAGQGLGTPSAGGDGGPFVPDGLLPGDGDPGTGTGGGSPAGGSDPGSATQVGPSDAGGGLADAGGGLGSGASGSGGHGAISGGGSVGVGGTATAQPAAAGAAGGHSTLGVAAMAAPVGVLGAAGATAWAITRRKQDVEPELPDDGE
ncbi:MAG: hypothetical protein HYR62_05365 [Actinobacteria bacterium]|nr:hypothetical protein [Actinomycetota bacterium]MBI3688470.1 hypothetical protein [Actinomycetota bacterium]